MRTISDSPIDEKFHSFGFGNSDICRCSCSSHSIGPESINLDNRLRFFQLFQGKTFQVYLRGLNLFLITFVFMTNKHIIDRKFIDLHIFLCPFFRYYISINFSFIFNRCENLLRTERAT